MNNKMFLNKEAGFLAHTKRKRRFAVTLVGVFLCFWHTRVLSVLVK